MKPRLVVLAAAALALAVSASAAHAQRPQGPGRPGGGPGRRMQMMFEGITLTSEQQARVDSIVASFRAQMPPFTPGAPPEPGAMARRRELMMRQDSSIRAVLTTEQQQVFDRNVEGMRAMFPQRPPGPPSR